MTEYLRLYYLAFNHKQAESLMLVLVDLESLTVFQHEILVACQSFVILKYSLVTMNAHVLLQVVSPIRKLCISS